MGWVRGNDQPPESLGLLQAVEDDVRLSLEALRTERLAGPHRDPLRTAIRSEQFLEIATLCFLSEASKGIEARLPQDVDRRIRVPNPCPCRGDISVTHHNDVTAVERGPSDRTWDPRPVLDVHGSGTMPLCGMRTESPERADVVAQQHGVRAYRIE